MSLDRIEGQKRAVRHLEKLLSEARVPHALLFTGPSGVGKATCAFELAKSLLCPKAAPRACDACASCGRVDSRMHADLYWVEPLAGRAAIGVDEMRELARALSETPLEAERKAAVIDPADALTVPAQNSLLKTLEEPPADTTIILVSENTDALLPTVRSRCMRVGFAPLADSEVESFLISTGADAETASAVARLSGGSFGRALSLLEEGSADRRAAFLGKVFSSGGVGTDEMTELLAAAGPGGRVSARDRRISALELLEALDSALCDALRVKAGSRVSANADLAGEIASFAGGLELDTLVELEKEVQDAIIVLGNNAEARLVAARVASAFSRLATAARS